MIPVQPRSRELAGRELGPAALRTFFRIAEVWGLGVEEQKRLLGVMSSSTYYKWRKTPPPRLSPDLLERISYVLGIYKALQILLPDERLADRWIRQPNTHPLFGGEPPLTRLLSGQVADLYVVRAHLDAERGG
jgi:uncharacterized protein (DUF2384 family)